MATGFTDFSNPSVISAKAIPQDGGTWIVELRQGENVLATYGARHSRDTPIKSLRTALTIGDAMMRGAKAVRRPV